MTLEMVEKFKSDANWNFVDTEVVVGSHTREYGRNLWKVSTMATFQTIVGMHVLTLWCDMLY